MLFNSLNFIIFLFAVVVIYYLLPRNSWRKVFLLGASYYFYACFELTMLSILLAVTGVAYAYGMLNQDRKRPKGLLASIIVLLLLPLLTFKYLDFLIDSTGDLLPLARLMVRMPDFELFLPIGKSFYSFMTMGYVVDVFKGKVSVEKNTMTY